jgi:hypothetical protein
VRCGSRIGDVAIAGLRAVAGTRRPHAFPMGIRWWQGEVSADSRDHASAQARSDA